MRKTVRRASEQVKIAILDHLNAATEEYLNAKAEYEEADATLLLSIVKVRDAAQQYVTMFEYETRKASARASASDAANKSVSHAVGCAIAVNARHGCTCVPSASGAAPTEQ